MKHGEAILSVLAVLVLACGCGTSSGAATHPTPSAPASALSASPSASPSPAAPSYSVHLALTGGLTGTIGQVQVDSNSGCSASRIDVNVVYRGQVWAMGVSVTGYRGPGSYPVTSGFNVMLSTPSYDIWMSTSGSATYAADTSLTVNVGMTNLMAGPGEPGATAHISGTISCS